MGCNVFANGREISAKKDDNKSVAAMADVCLSPPSPPAGPIPIPYPNTAQASDTTDGSKTVQIGGDEVGLKNTSSYKTSNGDEAATKSLGMGVVTHNIQGKMKHAAWSMDVKIEGQNAIRHMDLTTHNHMNCPNLALTMNAAAMARAADQGLSCKELNAMIFIARLYELSDPPGQPYSANPTVVTAYRQPASGPGRFMKALAPNVPNEEFANGYQPPVDKQDQPPCAGGRRPPDRPRNHGENKILHPEMDAQDGGTILMSISHPAPNPPPYYDANPCSSCRRSICEAEECGIEVRICRTDPPPDAFRPADHHLCPAETAGDEDPDWTSLGLGARRAAW
jgi:hypothetical protein